MEPWWRRSERLKWELAELSRWGFRFESPGDLEGLGPVTVTVYARIGKVERRLEATFPELYPYFRCEVRAPDVDLPYHQHRSGKNLCLLPRGTHSWGTETSLAWLLREQLPRLAAAVEADSADSAAELEEHQGEPVSDYYPYEIGDVVLVDGAWTIPPDFERGRVELAYSKSTGQDEPFRAVLREVQAFDGTTLFTAPDHLLGLYADRMPGDLVCINEPLSVFAAAEFHRRVRGRITEHWTGHASAQHSLLAVAFPEESSWRAAGGHTQGWLFVVGTRSKRSNQGQYRFVRGDRAGPSDLTARAPELVGLRDHRIAVIGLGCVGAPSALELARAGVGELRLLDKDRVEAATSLRWPFGLDAAGLAKVDVLGRFIRRNYPWTQVLMVRHVLGGEGKDLEALSATLEGATLIYDAAAEEGISYFLSEWARRAGIPYVCVSSLQGAWGGEVVRLLPDRKTGCWCCLQRAKHDEVIPAAPHDPNAWFQPTGCADPTFTGAGFDLVSVAMAGVRVAVSALTTGTGTYPELAQDVWVMSWRDKDGRLIPPNSQGFSLAAYPDCPACGTPARSG